MLTGLDAYKLSMRRFNSSTMRRAPNLPVSMSAWQVCGYNGFESLKLVNTVGVPPLYQPNDVLVEVKAASINSLDLKMTGSLTCAML